MKIQELAIIFIIIILPISLLLSEYTQFQIQTIKLQTEYDARLTSATYDAIRAFQLNASNSTTSDLANSKIRDLEASIETFRNSIMTGFELNGYTEDDLNNYIPALVYTLYDGFYIYSPYENTHDEYGNRILAGGDSIYGLKPYINYSCRYVKGNIDVVITYALDNYITVQGQIGDEYVNKSGYLIDGITYNEVTGSIVYNGIEIKTEHLKEDLLGRQCSYVKVNGTKYYFLNNEIVYILNGELKVQTSDPKEVTAWKIFMENNDSAKTYYREAYKFTKWLKEETNLDTLTYADARDEIIDDEGITSIGKVWKANETFIFRDDAGTNIENESSNFNQHRLAVIRHKIETNLAIAISNYNNYSGASSTNVFQMPKLKENEWDNITHNISLISFLQGLHIGGKVYNGYSIVTNSESKEVVTEHNIYILGVDSQGRMAYCKIGDKGFENETISVNAHEYYGVSEYGEDSYGYIRSAGRLNLDFERSTLINDNISYYYPLEEYNASYDSIVMQNNVTTYDDIYEYVNGQNPQLKEAFYTALGREREGKYRANTSVEYYSVLVAGYYSSEYNYKLNTHYITNKLNEAQNIKATYIFSDNFSTHFTNQITSQMKNYDLILVDAFHWSIPITNSFLSLISLEETNIMTIGNDSTNAGIQLIKSQEFAGNKTYVKPQITDFGKNILPNIGEIDNDADSGQHAVKFIDGVDVLYTGLYSGAKNGQYDLIGCWQREKYKWIHSQFNFIYNKSSHMELLKELVKYAVN